LREKPLLEEIKRLRVAWGESERRLERQIEENQRLVQRVRELEVRGIQKGGENICLKGAARSGSRSRSNNNNRKTIS
jgi:hypothetical protein